MRREYGNCHCQNIVFAQMALTLSDLNCTIAKKQIRKIKNVVQHEPAQVVLQ